MKKLPLYLAIICSFAGCDSKPTVKTVPLEEAVPSPSSTPTPQDLNKIEPEAIATPVPTPRLTNDGEFYLLERVSKVTESGIIAFAAGKKVTLVESREGILVVTDGKNEIEVENTKLTREIDLGEEIQNRATEKRQATAKAMVKNRQATKREISEKRTAADAAHRRSVNATKVRKIEADIQAAHQAVRRLEAEYKKSTKSYRQDQNGQWYRISDGGSGSRPDSIENRARKEKIARLQANMSAWKSEIRRLQTEE